MTPEEFAEPLEQLKVRKSTSWPEKFERELWEHFKSYDPRDWNATCVRISVSSVPGRFLEFNHFCDIVSEVVGERLREEEKGHRLKVECEAAELRQGKVSTFAEAFKAIPVEKRTDWMKNTAEYLDNRAKHGERYAKDEEIRKNLLAKQEKSEDA